MKSRATDKARGAVESAIVVLHAEREAIDRELQILMAMLKAGEPKKTKVARAKPAKPIVAQAYELLAGCDPKVGVTAAMLAERTGQSAKSAAQTLGRLFRFGKAKRVGRGAYRGVK